MIIFALASTLILLYKKYFRLTSDAYESALNSFIVSLVVLVVTVIVINLLFSHHHDKLNKAKEKKDYLQVLKGSHDSLVSQFKIYIITFVTKEMAVTSSDENGNTKFNIELTDPRNQLDTYVSKDFFTKNIFITTPGVEDLFAFDTLNQSHTDWLSINNNKILGNIHKYLMLYSKLMPNEILKLLIEIELAITQKEVFMVPNIQSFQNELNTRMLADNALEVFKKQLTEMINKIIEFEKSV